MTGPDGDPGTAAAALLTQVALPVPGLYRTHPRASLAAVPGYLTGAFSGRGPVPLGRRRRLVVLAVDGLGYRFAAAGLRPDTIAPHTSEFPSTTVSCLLTSVLGRPAAEHGTIGVQHLHPDGLRAVNCLDGRLFTPTSAVPPRPSPVPDPPTVFAALAAAGIGTTALPNELSTVDAGVRDRLLRGCATVLAPEPARADPAGTVAAVGARIHAALAGTADVLLWSYVDLDTHVHRYGMDPPARAAVAALDRLARELCREGATVLLYSDHGLARSAPTTATLAAFDRAADPRWCRLPPGGAGRVRWLYPHATHTGRVLDWLTGRLPGSVVTTPAQLAAWGLVTSGSAGQRRLGEVVLLALGPDFPAADPGAAFEHGSMTADEVAVPVATWHAEH